MFRSAFGLALVVLLLVGDPATAHARSPVPNPVCLVGACDEDGKDEDDPSKNSSCPLPATLVCAGGAIVDTAAGVVGDAAQGGLAIAGDAVMGGLTDWVASGAAWLLSRAATLLDRSTRPALGSTWFQRQYRSMIGLAVGLSLLLLLCAALQATLRQDPRALIRSALFALPVAMLLCFSAVTLVESSLAVTDWMSAAVLRHFERDTGEFFADVGEVLVPASLTGSPLPGFLLFLGALVTALATFVVWLELIMREAAIYLAVAFLPLCFVAMVWERTAHWCRRLVELLAAIVLAKLTIATAVAVAAGAMGHARPGQGGLTALLAGCAVMLIAALTPFMLLRLVPIADAAGHLSLHRGSTRAAIGAAPGAQTAAMVVRQSVLMTATPGSAAMARSQLLGAKRAAAAPPSLPRSNGIGGSRASAESKRRRA
jgi:hypothetical protein